MSKTPLTDHYTKRLRNFCGDEFVPIEFARKLERELAAVNEERDRYKIALDKYSEDEATNTLLGLKEQRDRLAEVLNDLWHHYSLTGAAYELIEKALAAVEGGSDE